MNSFKSWPTRESDGPTFIDESQWLRLPVGENFKDYQVTDFQVSLPSVKNYDWSKQIWASPVQSNVEQYLQNRSGMLTVHHTAMARLSIYSLITSGFILWNPETREMKMMPNT